MEEKKILRYTNMSYTNGFQTLVQSMNGLLTFNDGAGTVIENGTIITQSLSLNNILATLPTLVVNLWQNITNANAYLMTNLVNGSIYLGTALGSGTTGVLYLGNELCTIVLGSFNFLGNSIQSGIGGTINLFTTLTNPSILNVGNSVINMSFGAFSFIGKSIQSGTSGTFNFFTEVTGSSTVNFFSNMPSGTLNIGKGGNINIGQATTGSLIKIDQNGLDTQVIIAPQQGASGSVVIGSSSNSNKVGNLTTVGSDITSSTGTTRMNGQQELIYNTTATRPAYLEMFSAPSNTGFSNNYLDFHVGGNGSNVDYDVRMNVNAFNTTTAGTGSIRTSCGQEELLFSGNIPPRNLGTSYGIGFGHVVGTDNATYIAGYQPYGGVSIGGCGSSNPIASTTYVQAMTIYPYYGLRLYTGGINFDRGNLNSGAGSGRGFYIQTGQELRSGAIAGNAQVSITVTYPTAFGTAPTISLGEFSNAGTNLTQYLNYTIYGVGTSTFNVWIRNPTAAATTGGQVYGFFWTAIGGY
jgi:hypothetical protein